MLAAERELSSSLCANEAGEMPFRAQLERRGVLLASAPSTSARPPNWAKKKDRGNGGAGEHRLDQRPRAETDFLAREHVGGDDL